MPRPAVSSEQQQRWKAVSSTSGRRGLGPGAGAGPASRRTPPWAAPAPGFVPWPGSAEDARDAVSRLRSVPVQAAVLETALALARAVLASQAGHPAVQESARALSEILDRVLAPADAPVRADPPTAAVRSLPAPTVSGTGRGPAGLTG